MPCLKPPKREGECAPSVRKGRCWVALHWAGTARTTSPLDGDARTCTTEPEETKHPVLQRRYLFSERSVVRGWQDSRAVHDSGPVQRKEPFPGKIFTPCVPERRFAGLFGCIARISCHSQLISDAWRANLAANWRFSRPRPLSGCMERKTCHGLTPGNAFREHFAIVERLGTHQGIILPRPDARAERSARPCATTPCATMSCAAAPQRHALRRHAPQRPALQHHDAMRRTRRFCRR